LYQEISSESAIPKTVSMAISRIAEKLVEHFDVPNEDIAALKPSTVIYLARASHVSISGEKLSICFAFLGVSYRCGQWRQR